MKANGCATPDSSCKLSDGNARAALNVQDNFLKSAQDPRLLSFVLPDINALWKERLHHFELHTLLSPALEIHTPPPRILT